MDKAPNMPPRKPRRRLSESEFQRVLSEVWNDIGELQFHDVVFTGVIENLTTYPGLTRNFSGFFNAFLSAMRTDLVIRLGRVYDPETGGRETCSLARCLQVIRDNPQFFTHQSIHARLSGAYRKAHPNYLDLHRPDLKQIDKDLLQITRIRKRLIRLRHKRYAHKDLDTVLTGRSRGFLSTTGEVKELILLAHQIWNRCSFTWSATTSGDRTIGENDCKRLFTCLRRGLKFRWLLERQQLERMRQGAECRIL